MEQVFAALRNRHPGYEVVDFRLSVDDNFIGPIENDLDFKLAEAIKNAVEVDIESIFGVQSS